MSSAPGSSRQMIMEMEEERLRLLQSQKAQQVSDDEEDSDDETDESDQSEGADIEINDVDESLADLSIFNNNEDSDSSESLLDLDDSAFNSMNETKMALYEMMDTCQELDEKIGFQAGEDKILRQQVHQSATLFQKQFMPDSGILEKNKTMWKRQKSKLGDSESLGSTPKQQDSHSSFLRPRAKNQAPAGGMDHHATTQTVKPSDMFLAYKHTNMCAHLLRKRTDDLGLEETVISIEDYIDGLKQMIGEDAIDTDLEDAAQFKLYQLVTGMWKTAPSLPTFVGAFDYKEHLAKEDTVIEKPGKKEVRRRGARNFDPDSLIATQVEVSISKEASVAKSKANDDVVKKFRKNLIDFTDGRESANVYEFTVNKESMIESLNNMFGVAFGVRDGTIELKREDKQLKISSVPPSTAANYNMSERRQCIMSISAATMRKLQEIAEGENAIQP